MLLLSNIRKWTSATFRFCELIPSANRFPFDQALSHQTIVSILFHEDAITNKKRSQTNISADPITKMQPIMWANNCAQSRLVSMSWVCSVDTIIAAWSSFVQSGLRYEINVDRIRFKCRHALKYNKRCILQVLEVQRTFAYTRRVH